MNMRSVRPVLRPLLAPHDPLVRWCDRCESWAALTVTALVVALLPVALIAGWAWGSVQYSGMVAHRHDVVAQVVLPAGGHEQSGVVEVAWFWDGQCRTGRVADRADQRQQMSVTVDDSGRQASIPGLGDVRSSRMGAVTVLWMLVVAASAGTVRAMHSRAEQRRAAFWDAELHRFLGAADP